MYVLIAVAISIHPGVVCSHVTSLVSRFQSHVSGWDLPYQPSQEAIAKSHLPTEKKGKKLLTGHSGSVEG